MAIIQLEGMEFYAYHGCFSEEQIIGSRFIIDVTFECDVHEAENSDILSKTIDYQDVYNTICGVMQIKSKLLEHVGRRIIIAVKERFPLIEDIKVKVSKCNPPIGGKVEKVSVLVGNMEE